MIRLYTHQIWCRSVYAPIRKPMSVFEHDEKALLINSASHFAVVLKFGSLMEWCTVRLWRLGNFENQLPIESKIANTGSECKITSIFEPPPLALPQLWLSNGARYVTSKTAALCMNECPMTSPNFHLVQSTLLCINGGWYWKTTKIDKNMGSNLVNR